MGENKLTPEQFQALMQFASQKLGTTPEKLASTVNNNGIDFLTSKLSSNDKAKLDSIVNNKSKLEEMLNSPQAQKLIEQLTKKKK